MNVFELLGLPADHRAKDKVVQLVKHYDEVPDSRKKFPLVGQVKKDGNFVIVVVRDHVGSCHLDVGVFGRTGSHLSSVKMLETTLHTAYLRSGIYIGELLSSYPCSLEQLSGVVSPERVNALTEEQKLIRNGLYIAFHDCLPMSDFIRGVSTHAYILRHASLTKRLENTGLEVLPFTLIHDEEAKAKFTQACIAANEEGACYKSIECGWEAGHKGWHVMKEVRGVSYDLLCVGYEEGKGKYSGKVANLIFQWKSGETIKAMLGKGWTHEDAAILYRAIQSGNTALNPIGKIFKVNALQESSKGKLRLPKVREVRHDKTESDY